MVSKVDNNDLIMNGNYTNTVDLVSDMLDLELNKDKYYITGRALLRRSRSQRLRPPQLIFN